MKKAVGIIGPYIAGGNSRLIDHNIANAKYIAARIANYFGESKLVGFFCPHSHTARFDVLARAPESYYYALDDFIYDCTCSGFILLPGWEKSSGATRDHERARKRGATIFVLKSYDEEDIKTLLGLLEMWALSLETDC